MTAYNDPSSVQQTLSGTSQDVVTITSAIGSISIQNQSAAQGLWFKLSDVGGTAITAGSAGTTWVPPNTTVTVNCGYGIQTVCQVVGNGNIYSVKGGQRYRGQTPASIVNDPTAIALQAGRWPNGELLAQGESVFPRSANAATTIAVTSGTLILSGFVAGRTEQVSRLRWDSYTVSAGATPTLCRLGFYLMDATGGLTLIGSTPNDTTMFAVTFGTYTRSMSASATKTAGQAYAIGALVVSSFTMPTFMSSMTNWNQAQQIELPWRGKNLAGQSDLPSSIAFGSLTSASSIAHAQVLV